MKEKQTQMWIPLYVDKWIFGSTRIELEPAERGVFVDLLAFGAKDNGFIRANEITPYHHRQLSGLLNIPVELLESTIAKCIHFGKIEEPSTGIYKIASWDKFQLSNDYKYRLEHGKRAIPGTPVRDSSDTCPKKDENTGPIREDKRVEDKIEKNTSYSEAFVEFWKAYPKKTGKDAAYKSWKAKNPPIYKCLLAISWQVNSDQWKKEGGQYIPMPSTWLNQARWEDVSPEHDIVNCVVCNKEGILKKGFRGVVKCKECKALETTPIEVIE